MSTLGEPGKLLSGPIEAAWISKNCGDDMNLQFTYTCIRVLDRKLAHASKKDKLRHRPGRDEATHSMSSMTPEKNCSSEHVTAKESAASAF
ncbi:unnamed protein product [Angiostrongylus costaricensis]|uniref:Uncharacterized protein n=1 Tax=Angiostrongylus costaricensis TaxID=334426 RepID=A0A0R3PSF1_ANGCS|nr:unnamed protein product [Angiostrongylus costaricensis]